MGKNMTTAHVNSAMNDGVAHPKEYSTYDHLEKALPVKDTLRYVKNDTFVADVAGLLGRVYYEKLPGDTLVPALVAVNAPVNPESRLKAPQKRSELILSRSVKAHVGVLSMIGADLSDEDALEIVVVDNAAARIVDRGGEWEAALESWLKHPLTQQLIDDPGVGRIAVVTGVVQKYLTTKKFKKFQVGTKGGAYGVNLNGSLFTSSSEFELTVIYGLDLVTFRQAKNVQEFAETMAKPDLVLEEKDVQEVARKFDRMAEGRLSVFRVADALIPTQAK